jgi:hypothetical protein
MLVSGHFTSCAAIELYPSGTSTLLLTLGVSLLAEAAVVGPRALSTGLPFATGHRDSDGGRSGPSRPPVTTRVPARAEGQDWSQDVPSPGPAYDDYRRHDHHHHDHHHDHHGRTGPS